MNAQKTATSVPEYMKNIRDPPASDPFGLDGEGKGIKGFRSTGTNAGASSILKKGGTLL
jgi:hypothetical protein